MFYPTEKLAHLTASQKVADKVEKFRVLLVDDHALVRAGIRALLERGELVESVAEAGDGHEAVELISKVNPDLVLLDLTMPGLGGLEVLTTIGGQFPNVRVIVLSVHERAEYAFLALRAGAAGYLPKSAASAELELAIQHVMNGGTYLSPSIKQDGIFELGATTGGIVSPSELTPRQLEVLKLIAEGYSTKNIARALNISVKTVETHRAQLMDRLNIHEIAGLVRYAIKTGLISLEERAPEKKMGGGSDFF